MSVDCKCYVFTKTGMCRWDWYGEGGEGLEKEWCRVDLRDDMEIEIAT